MAGTTLIVDLRNSKVPLSLTVSRAGEGGISGLSPTVSIRDGSTINSYLDWSDHAFKTSGWTTKYVTLSPSERGHYQRTLDLTQIAGLVDGMSMVAEFHVDNGSDVKGDAHDILLLTSVSSNSELLRKLATNRLEETAGNPGTIILYDDDAFTPLLTWQIRDAAGGAVLAAVGAPARRARAT